MPSRRAAALDGERRRAAAAEDALAALEAESRRETAEAAERLRGAVEAAEAERLRLGHAGAALEAAEEEARRALAAESQRRATARVRRRSVRGARAAALARAEAKLAEALRRAEDLRAPRGCGGPKTARVYTCAICEARARAGSDREALEVLHREETAELAQRHASERDAADCASVSAMPPCATWKRGTRLSGRSTTLSRARAERRRLEEAARASMLELGKRTKRRSRASRTRGGRGTMSFIGPRHGTGRRAPRSRQPRPSAREREAALGAREARVEARGGGGGECGMWEEKALKAEAAAEHSVRASEARAAREAESAEAARGGVGGAASAEGRRGPRDGGRRFAGRGASNGGRRRRWRSVSGPPTRAAARSALEDARRRASEIDKLRAERTGVAVAFGRRGRAGSARAARRGACARGTRQSRAARIEVSAALRAALARGGGGRHRSTLAGLEEKLLALRREQAERDAEGEGARQRHWEAVRAERAAELKRVEEQHLRIAEEASTRCGASETKRVGPGGGARGARGEGQTLVAAAEERHTAAVARERSAAAGGGGSEGRQERELARVAEVRRDGRGAGREAGGAREARRGAEARCGAPRQRRAENARGEREEVAADEDAAPRPSERPAPRPAAGVRRVPRGVGEP